MCADQMKAEAKKERKAKKRRHRAARKRDDERERRIDPAFSPRRALAAAAVPA